MSGSNWRDHDWQLIHAPAQPPALHMALDDVLMDEVGRGHRPPTLRIWEWAGPAVVIGRFQSLRNEVDAEAAERHGIKVVRRISGGGAMFIEPGNTITYSIVAPDSLVDGMGFEQAYAYMDEWVLAALAGLGIDAWYQPLNDITSAAGKIAGAAQARRGRTVLHHVTMAYDKGTASAAKRVDPLRSQTGLPREAVIEKMLATFRERHGGTVDTLKPDELQRAEALATTKFMSREWTTVVR